MYERFVLCYCSVRVELKFKRYPGVTASLLLTNSTHQGDKEEQNKTGVRKGRLDSVQAAVQQGLFLQYCPLPQQNKAFPYINKFLQCSPEVVTVAKK